MVFPIVSKLNLYILWHSSTLYMYFAGFYFRFSEFDN